MLVNQTNDRERIARLQRMLRWLARRFDLPKIKVNVTGVYNPQTEAAVRAFQEWGGLPATGVCGRETWDRLVDLSRRESGRIAPVPLLSVPADPDFRLREGDRSDSVRVLQALLGELGAFYGFDPVPVTGIYDGPTEKAVRQYRERAGMEPDGGADREMWHRLAEEAYRMM
ncbi:MAG: peptidoglycan-binding protein [Clostridia bacterium]|nr:peptidoglycan-binding protein [Clostridia bacterium]